MHTFWHFLPFPNTQNEYARMDIFCRFLEAMITVKSFDYFHCFSTLWQAFVLFVFVSFWELIVYETVIIKAKPLLLQL